LGTKRRTSRSPSICIQSDDSAVSGFTFTRDVCFRFVAFTADVCFLMGPVNSAVNHQSITFIAGIDSSRSSIPTRKSPPRTKSSTRECFRRPELIHPPATLLPPATALTFPDRPPLSSTDSFSRGFVPPQCDQSSLPPAVMARRRRELETWQN
jgi:hypothetical protein